MSSQPNGCTGSLTADVLDDLCETHDTQCIFANGTMMKAVFTPLTEKTISYRTAPA
jgi:hypothetical protein